MLTSTVSVSMSQRMRQAFNDAEARERTANCAIAYGRESRPSWLTRLIARTRTVLRI